MERNRIKFNIEKSVVPHKPVKGDPTPEELERRRPKGYALTLDQFERDDDAGNISEMEELNISVVNSRLSITPMTEEEKKQLKRLKRHDKLRIKNHGDRVELVE